ncbi:hypothetical protein [Trichothermofontia sp.]
MSFSSYAIAGISKLNLFFQTANQAARSQPSLRPSLEHSLYFRETNIWLALLCVGVFLAAYSSPILTMPNDSTGTLLTAQAILQHGTIKLDAYRVLGSIPYGLDYQFIEKGSHLYYYFPLGSSLYVIPFVYLANWLRLDMNDLASQNEVENLLAALTVTLAFLLIYNLCRQFTQQLSSLFLTGIFVFGSSIASTLTTSLWSINLAPIFILLSLLLLIYDYSKIMRLNSILLGWALFSAYLCRPSTAVFILIVFAYLLIRRRQEFTKVLLVFLAFLLGFILFSTFEYGQVLPDYYLPSRLKGGNFWVAVYGHLFSPSRGLIVYSPFLILTCIGVGFFFQRIARQPLFWFATFWFVGHLTLVARFPHWWGGHGYGARLFTEAFPATIILSLLVWQQIFRRHQYTSGLTLLSKSSIVGLVTLFASAAVFINTLQGLYNFYPRLWNDMPNVDRYPNYLFDWQYPQFLASSESIKARNNDHWVREAKPYSFGSNFLEEETSILFLHWFPLEKDPDKNKFRWSEGNVGSLSFRINPASLQAAQQYEIQLAASVFFAPQTITVKLNDRVLGTLDASESEVRTLTLPVARSWLEAQATNVIELSVPTAFSPAGVLPGNRDLRLLGIRLEDMRLIASH